MSVEYKYMQIIDLVLESSFYCMFMGEYSAEVD